MYVIIFHSALHDIMIFVIRDSEFHSREREMLAKLAKHVGLSKGSLWEDVHFFFFFFGVRSGWTYVISNA